MHKVSGIFRAFCLKDSSLLFLPRTGFIVPLLICVFFMVMAPHSRSSHVCGRGRRAVIGGALVVRQPPGSFVTTDERATQINK